MTNTTYVYHLLIPTRDYDGMGVYEQSMIFAAPFTKERVLSVLLELHNAYEEDLELYDGHMLEYYNTLESGWDEEDVGPVTEMHVTKILGIADVPVYSNDEGHHTKRGHISVWVRELH